ncbi:MAG: outer membrane beta-barrel protein [Gammaproteobacteria bacterium]|jgi:hypothetical protein
MNPHSRVIVAILLYGWSLLAANAIAAPGNRTGAWQVSLIPSFTNSQSIQSASGAQADINEHSGFGIGIGYNYSDHLEIDLDFGSGNANYSGTRVLDDGNNTQEQYTGSFYTSHMNLGLTYNFMAARLTPFIKGNIGLTYIDSGIPTGDIASGCWWDWWGYYYCGTYAFTYTTTDLSYGADLGLRFDISNKIFIKGSIGKTYIDLNNTETPDFTQYKFIVGFSFR